MPSTREYLDYVLKQLSLLPDITYRPMMGEFIIYYRGKVIGGVYDNRFLVKDTLRARYLMSQVILELPYKGGRPMLKVEDLNDLEFLQKLVETMGVETSP